MSFCGEFLERYKATHELKQFELAALFGLSESHISHILSGKKTGGKVKGIEPATLAKILAPLNESERAAFIQCYIRDIVPPAFQDAIKGHVEETPPTGLTASSKLIAAIRESDAPSRITKVLLDLVKKAKGRPEYIAALAKIADI